MVKRTTFVKSIMSFNQRVLYNGNINPGKIYTIDELNRKLFFNEIFIENMQEIFQRHNCNDIKEDYLETLNDYVKNIFMIINELKKMNSLIELNNHVYQDIIVDPKIINNITYSSINDVDYKFMDDIIYYISLLKDGKVIISNVSDSCYADIIQLNNLKYIKLDNFIINYINKIYNINNTIAVRITKNRKTFEIRKVEVNGNEDNIKGIINIFPKNVFILLNPFIYLRDIKYTINSMTSVKIVKDKQEFLNISFNDIFKKDMIFEYPYTSFNVYLHLLSLAADSKEVRSIYVSLYRIGKDSTIYEILKRAIANKIKVYVNIELYASGEFINQMWAEEMKKAGINVITYAKGKIKVHSKLTLIQFNDGRLISQVGTGNYHTQTTSQYTDLSFITSDRNICNQILNLFHVFRYGNNSTKFDEKLLVTRFNGREELIKLIKNEIKKKDNGYITIKCNALDDEEIIKYLDEAAKNNCQIDLVIRGVCTWIPDQLGFNVRIKSIVWDKLEHSRVYCFGSADPVVYIGSLDLVTNKLDKRIETLVKITDPYVVDVVCGYLNKYVSNIKDSWILLRSGKYMKEGI